MFHVLQVLTLILVALAMAPALAHALELPGKMRLTREAYFAVQPIYYPGFTIADGLGEAVGLISTLILLLVTPRGTAAFWLTLVALLGLVGMQAVYWMVTHPVNRHWLQGQALGSLGSEFFSFDPGKRSEPSTETVPSNWTELRDRWEYSHLARAGLAVLSFIALLIAIS